MENITIAFYEQDADNFRQNKVTAVINLPEKEPFAFRFHRSMLENVDFLRRYLIFKVNKRLCR